MEAGIQADDDSSGSDSDAPAPNAHWEANRYRRGTMHAMADAILERMAHLKRKQAKDVRKRHASAVSASPSHDAISVNSRNPDERARMESDGKLSEAGSKPPTGKVSAARDLLPLFLY